MSYEQPRITLHMTLEEVIKAVAGGNPGALRVCVEVMNRSKSIDPDALLGGLSILMDLDTGDIYEDRIWMLYKDVCGEDLVNMFAALRSVQLGINTQESLNHAIDNGGDGFDVPAALTAVQEQLPKFGRETAEVVA